MTDCVVACRWSPTAKLCRLAATLGSDGVREIVDIKPVLSADELPTAAAVHVTSSAAYTKHKSNSSVMLTNQVSQGKSQTTKV